MSRLLKENTILMHKVTGQILVILEVSPLCGKDVFGVVFDAGVRHHLFSFINPNTKHTNYEYIGEL